MVERTNTGAVRQAVEIFEARKSTLIDTSAAIKSNDVPSTATTTMSEVTYALPSPTDTPYRTPSSSRSRQTSRTYDDGSPGTTPPPLPSAERARKRSSTESMNIALDESLPISDPRRFTPTLHASLVSEILSLRRDAEIRTKDIEQFEQRLHNALVENETLNDNLLAANREARQAKRQMQILEGGTLSAINDLGKERDDAVKDVAELRSRLEQSQRRAKNQEDSVAQVQEQWEKDRESWAAEKRTLETKIHIVEGRLKVVLSEVAKAQQLHGLEDVNSPRRSQSRTSILGSPRKRPDSVAQRRQSTTSMNSDQAGGRNSVMSFANGEITNLADELALEDIEEDYASQLEEDGRRSFDALPEETTRPASRISLKAMKVLGLPLDLCGFEQARKSTMHEPMPSPTKITTTDIRPQLHYVDTGIQYSRPSSPVANPDRSLETPVPRNRESVDASRASKRLSAISQDSAQYSVDTADNAWEENLRNQPIMVSSACQTIEQLPSPSTISNTGQPLPTIDEIVETREIAVQTDLPPRMMAPMSVTHRRTDTEQTATPTDLQIPAIAIMPPTSRPATPDELTVRLPPRTKNASCQVETHVLCDYNSKGMQTEEIRIDKRNMVPPQPLLPPPPIPANAPPPSSFKPTIQAKTQAFARRNLPNAANSSMRRSIPSQALPPINDDGPLSDSERTIGRPVRSSSMFAGFEDGEENDDFDDDVFHDEEFFNRPMTKFILSKGKIMSATKDLDDVEESEAAVAAGKRFALEQIRRSQEDERDFVIDEELQVKQFPRQPSKQARKVPSRSNSIRRTALISSGTAVHQAKSSLSSLGSGDNSRPPVPIPVRYSSARVGKSISDGGRTSRGSSNASPTKNIRRIAKPALRKTRSGPAISPAAQAARRARSRSPPLDSRVSIVPEMPNFQMPSQQHKDIVKTAMPLNTYPSFEASAPRPTIGQGPIRATSSHVKNNSDAFTLQQTSVVDAIAQTMVGEWMFKYVRRRKSFGKPDKDWDPNKSVEEMSSSASSGVRHKRWVWLAPYERSVMWSSKQPTDGTSLLGKSGRKLTIKSVLDVKDDNPMPKGTITGSHFNRSILILTPQRALKFTATTEERHYIWLTALSFLSHSPINMNDLAPMPPIPLEEHDEQNTSPAASLGGSLRRRPIRDSIRIAKGSNQRPTFRSFTTDGIPTMSVYERPRTQEQYDPVNDAAMPPVIRRYHNRNRSNTAPKPTASAFRALLSRDPAPPVSTTPSVAVTSEKNSTDRGPLTPSLGVPSMPTSRRGSEASAMDTPPLPPLSNIDSRFFDPMPSNSSHASAMTMKMDAFMADQQRVAVRGPSGRGLRSLRLGKPSMRNLKDPSTSSWVPQDIGPSSRDSMSPVDLNNLTTPTEMRFSESTGRGSSEAGGYFRGL